MYAPSFLKIKLLILNGSDWLIKSKVLKEKLVSLVLYAEGGNKDRDPARKDFFFKTLRTTVCMETCCCAIDIISGLYLLGTSQVVRKK